MSGLPPEDRRGRQPAAASGASDAVRGAMNILGIETSCDESAAAIVTAGRDGRLQVRSSVVATQFDLHRKYDGVVPEIASRAHLERLHPVIEAALAEARLSLESLDAIAVGHRPGLIGSLLVGVSAAKALAWSLSLPLLGVDHIAAHLTAGLLDADPPQWPALGLVASGGHTSLFLLDDGGSIALLGRTIDDAVGEAFDKVGTLLDLPYPGGPAIDRLAAQGNDQAYDFPISLPRRDSLDFSFSGLKTAVLYEVRPPARRSRSGEPNPVESARTVQPLLDDSRRADLAASFQRAAIGALIRKLELAHLRHPTPTLLVGGGVTANSRLRAELAEFAASRSIDLRLPKLSYCIDNAAMIAGAAASRALRGERDSLDLAPSAVSAVSSRGRRPER